MKKKLIGLLLLSAAWASPAMAESYSGATVTDEGAWCWFADPRAIHYENDSKSINASYMGYIDVHGNIKAMQMDFNTGRRDEVLVRSYFQPDDHDNPTFLVLPDERVLIIYSRHTDEAAFYYRVSQKPGDITTLGAEHRLATANNTTYPSPFIMSDDPTHFYLCWRGIGWHPTIARLTLPDENDNVEFDWGPFQMVQSTGARPYAKYYSNGKDKIYVTYTTGHPDNEQPNWVYFNVININGGNKPTLSDIKGNQLSVIENGKFNVNKTDSYKSSYPYTVVDAPSDKRDWVWQTLLDTDGNPAIAMVRINSAKSQHEYYYAKWTGDSWRLTDLADGGGKFHPSNTEYCYSGGEAIDPENPNIIYLSIPTEGDHGKVYEIWKYTLDANGNVTDKTAITKNSEKNNVRPYMLPGSANSPLRLGWMNGDYYYWIVKKDYPLGYPTGIRCDYQWPEVASVPAAADSKSLVKSVTATDTESLAFNETNAFTVNANVSISSSNYGGTVLTIGDIVFGLDKDTALPYVTVNGTRYDSTNKLYTSDAWASNSSGTSGDNWKTYLTDFNATITYDGKNLRVYRNGLLDQNLEAAGLKASGATIGGFAGKINSACAYTEALTSESVKAMLSANALDNLGVPATVCTDIVLPNKVGGSAVSWTSSNSDILSPSGIYNAPAAETEVTLIAISQGSQKEFKTTVLPRDLANNLLAKYDFETATKDGNDTKVADSSGKGNDLTVMGSAKIDGTLNLTANTAAGFDNNGYALLPSEIADGLRSYTVLVDVNAASLSGQPRLLDFGINAYNSFFVRANTLCAGIKYNGGTTTMTSASTQLAANKVQQLAVTYNAANHETCIYLNGTLVGSGTQNVNEPYLISEQGSTLRNYLGRTQWWDTSEKANNVDFVGMLDNFYFYNIALTIEEIHELQGFKEEDEELNVDYSQVIANRDFEGTYSVLANSGVSSDRAIYVPEGWEAIYENRNENDMSVLNSSDLYASLFTAIPTTNGGGKNAYLVRQKWGTSSISLTQVCDTLPAAIYSIGGDVWQSGLGGNGTIWAQPQGGTKAATSVSSNVSEWQKGKATFQCNGAQKVTFGITAVHTDNSSEKFLGFDNITLFDITANCADAEVLELLESMISAADNALNGELADDVKTVLTNASRNAKTVNATSARTELMTAYGELRDALRALNGAPISGIDNIVNDMLGVAAPVYDLSGRIVLRQGSAEAISTLKPGIYLQGNKKLLVK